MDEATLNHLLVILNSIVNTDTDISDIDELKEGFWGESNTDDAIDAGHAVGYEEGQRALAQELLELLTK